ncbi:MAG: hypothetical protein ABIL21_08350, partial [candidate division WOR-3 bacterium]
NSKIGALDEKLEAYYKELGTRMDALDQKLVAYQRETNARFEALNQRIDALDQKLVAYQRETNARFEALNEKLESFKRGTDAEIDALRSDVNSKFNKITLILYFLIILNILAMTLFNPNFVQFMKLLFKM